MVRAPAGHTARRSHAGSRLRVLHVTSDWKWTGPAEPMVRLGLALRAQGHDVQMACPDAPEGADRALRPAAEKLGLAPAVTLERARGLRPLADRSDVAALGRLLRDGPVDVVHAWHTRDHLLALRAAGVGRRETAVVRSWRMGEEITPTPWNRLLFGRGTDGLVCVSPGTARACAAIRPGLPVRGVFGAVDLERFQPAMPDPRVRQELGLAPHHRVIGIVARVQPHRRFDLLLEAARLCFAKDPDARLLILGRGTHREAVAEGPARKLGIADRVVFGGYRREDYADVLRSMDVFTFLVPGSDGSCRALLEAQACGVPAVTTRRGALAEIVEDGTTGRLVPEYPEPLAAAWAELLGDAALRAQQGRAAREGAVRRFDPERQGQEVAAFYEDVCQAKRAAGR